MRQREPVRCWKITLTTRLRGATRPFTDTRFPRDAVRGALVRVTRGRSLSRRRGELAGRTSAFPVKRTRTYIRLAGLMSLR